MKKNLLAWILIFSVTAMAGENASLPLPSAGNVTLPIAEYNKLLDLVRNPVKRPEAPPLAYSIQRAELKFRVAQESVLGTVQLDGEVFSKGATKVPLTSGMTILDAHQQSKPLPLEQEGAISTAILPGPADFSVLLDAGLQLSIEAGRASFHLPVPLAGTVQLNLVIPGDHTNIRISPGLITSRTSANGQTTIEATLVPSQPVTVWWATREVATPTVPKEVRFLSDIKTLVSVNEADLRVAVLANVTVVQGEPAEFTVQLPQGYEVTETSGSTIEESEFYDDGTLVLKLTGGSLKNHQFLITMEKPITGTKADAPFVSFKNAQRETGEVLVEGTGAMELTAKEGGGLKRLDVKEVNSNLRALARFPLQAAFRYHRQPAETPTLSLEWVRFPDTPVLAAVADWAIVTTLVTSEGRSLTEVKLVLKNQAQPFLKVDLPTGATILSADVAGEKVKPVQGPDGNRVPLLRAGFRPTGSYTVSFVFLHSGAPFAKKGGSELTLPKMDLPISVLQWEVFLPEQYKVKDFGGDAVSANMQAVVFANAASLDDFMNVDGAVASVTKSGPNTFSGVTLQDFKGGKDKQSLDNLALFVPGVQNNESLVPGEVAGFVVDPQGAVIPNAQITLVHPESGTTLTAVADSNGRFVVSGVPSGDIKITATVQGFKTYVRDLYFDSNKVAKLDIPMSVAAASEVVEVQSSAALIKEDERRFDRLDREAKKTEATQQNAASSNVFNLQKRVAGVLPVPVDVPRAGNSYRFVRPLVLDEETRLTFNYKTAEIKR